MRAFPLCLTLFTIAAPALLSAQVHDPWREENAVSSAPPPATVAALALSIRSRAHLDVDVPRAIQDSRCYLMSGGAVESFFISEDTPVGSIVGTLSVNGDPDEARGDITLHVQEKGAAVGIAPGTKNVTLLRPLDREEKRGPSNVYVNVRCDRRRTTDPSFVIPVSIRVWDVNDNAPAWVGAPYVARAAETAAVGSRLLAARATDADQPGPHATIHYSVLPGPHQEYVGFANELDGVIVVKKQLDFETLPKLTVTLRASDAGSPPLHNDTTLTVEVLDADDQNPAFTHEHYTAILPDDAQPGTVLETSPGPISAADRDVGIDAPLYYSVTGERRRLVSVERDSGRLAVTPELLAAALPVTIVVKATQVDNVDRYALATVSVSRAGASAGASAGANAGASGVRFVSRQYAGAVREDAAPPQPLLALLTDPPPHPTQNPLQFFVSDRSFLEKFAINSAGEVVLRRPLDYETQDHYHYQVMVTDGHTNDTASINLTVVNVNEWEPRFRYPQYEFRVDVAEGEEEGEGEMEGEGRGGRLLRVGRLDVFDGDRADTVTVTLRGPDANMLYMADDGEMFLRLEAVPHLNTSVLNVVATAIDSGDPPRQTSVPVWVHVGARGAAGAGAGRAGRVAAGGAALALLVALGALGALYLRTRRRSKSSPAPVAKPYLAHEKPPSAPLPPSGGGTTREGATAGAGGGGGGTTGSLQSVSAGASTILANSTSSLDLRDSLTQHNGVGVAGAGVCAGGAGGAGLLSDHLARGAGGGRSGVAWPAATIPARVKKLSWDDTHDQSRKESSEGPLEATNCAAHDHMNLTVYF